MPLSKASMKTQLVDLMGTYLGSAEDSSKRGLFADALSEWMFNVMTNDAVVTTTTTSAGATATGPAGGPLPIAALPGTGSGGLS